MQRIANPTTLSAILLAGLVTLTGTPAPAQNAAAARADMRAGHNQSEGMIMRVDALGRLVVIDGYSYLLADKLAVNDLHVGQAVTVTFEPSGLGAQRRAIRISPR